MSSDLPETDASRLLSKVARNWAQNERWLAHIRCLLSFETLQTDKKSNIREFASVPSKGEGTGILVMVGKAATVKEHWLRKGTDFVLRSVNTHRCR